jgi:hypothetical protein
MWTAILSFLGGPIVNGAIKAYQAKLAAGNTTEKIAADLATRELAVQQRELEVEGEYKRALIGRWYEPVNLLAYIIVFYVFVVVVWDTVLGMGVTNPVRGQVGDWMGAVVLFLVGKRGFENVARIIRK